MKISLPTLVSFCVAAILFTFTAAQEQQVTSGGSGGHFSGRVYLNAGSMVQLRGGSKLDGIDFFGVRFGGTGGTPTNTLTLRENEYINAFSIRGGSEVDRLSLSTNLGQSVTAGGNGGTEIRRNGIRLMSMEVRSGNRIDQITLYYTEMDNVLKTITFGGTGGDAFDEIGFYRIGLESDNRLDKIVLNGNEEHGGTGGGPLQEMRLASDEYINSFSIRHDSEIDFVRFSTNSGQAIEGGKSRFSRHHSCMSTCSYHVKNVATTNTS